MLGLRDAVPALIALVAAVAVSSLSIEHTPASLARDEFYHVLAAESWLREGAFRVAGGVYERASLFTWSVAQSMRAAPGSIALARLPAVLAGGLLVVAVALWVGRFDRNAAWVAGTMLGLLEPVVQSAQAVRFYSLHALAFWVGAGAIYTAWYSSGRRRLAASAVAVAALALAFHLQATTAIGIAALGVWMALAWVIDAPAGGAARRGLFLIAAAAGLCVTLLVARDLPAIADAVATYRWTPTWAVDRRDDWRFYYEALSDDLGLLFYLLPVAAIVAAATAVRPALFASVLLAIPLVIHSGAGAKSVHYIVYALPFFAVLWGLAAIPMVRALRGPARSAALALRAPGRVGDAMVVVALAVLLLDAPALTRPLGKAARLVFAPVAVRTESAAWIASAPELRRRAANTSVFVTVDDTRALYFLGGYDLMLNATRRDDYAARDFAIDPRTGGASIATARSMRLVIDCYPSGLLLVPRYAWRKPAYVAGEVADVIEARTEAAALRHTDLLTVWEWRRPDGEVAQGCGGVYRVAGRPDLGRFANVRP